MSNIGWETNESLDRNAEPLSGLLNGSIVKAEPAGLGGKNGEPKKPGIKLQIRVTDFFQGEKLEAKETIFDQVVITQAAAFRWAALADSAGVEAPTSNGVTAVKEFADSLVGQPVIVDVKVDEYEGRKSSKVKTYLTEEQAERLFARQQSAAE
jgi:hypothetical protein